MSVLAAGGIALLGGESGVGKTAAALHLARNMAALPEGTYAPVGLGLTGKGGSVLCVTTDIAPQLISARLHALVKRENSGLMATENPSAEHCLSRIHVLNLCDDPLYRAAIPLRVADRIGGFLKNTFQKTNGLDCEETTAWNDVREAIHLIRPILVLINTAWLDRPATAARFIRSINDMAQRIREKSPDYPVPGFLLINHSSLGAFGSKDPTAYESPEAPWSAALTLARTRSKAKRVLRIVHFGQRIQLPVHAVDRADSRAKPRASIGIPKRGTLGSRSLWDPPEEWTQAAKGCAEARGRDTGRCRLAATAHATRYHGAASRGGAARRTTASWSQRIQQGLVGGGGIRRGATPWIGRI